MRALLAVVIVVPIALLPVAHMRASPGVARDLVVMDDVGVVRLFDAATGEELGRAGERGSISSAVAGAGGTLFVAVPAEDEGGTDV